MSRARHFFNSWFKKARAVKRTRFEIDTKTPNVDTETRRLANGLKFEWQPPRTVTGSLTSLKQRLALTCSRIETYGKHLKQQTCFGTPNQHACDSAVLCSLNSWVVWVFQTCFHQGHWHHQEVHQGVGDVSWSKWDVINSSTKTTQNVCGCDAILAIISPDQMIFCSFHLSLREALHRRSAWLQVSWPWCHKAGFARFTVCLSLCTSLRNAGHLSLVRLQFYSFKCHSGSSMCRWSTEPTCEKLTIYNLKFKLILTTLTFTYYLYLH